MATRIIEYGGADRSDGLPVVPSRQKVTAQAAMTATAVSQQSAAFAQGTTLVLVQSDEQVYVSFGESPTATTNDYRIAAGGEQFFSVKDGHKVAIRT